jgi:hypothetical protein
VSTLKKIRIRRYPPPDFSNDSKSRWASVVVPAISEREKELLMLFKANPNHPLVVKELSEIVEIEVDDKAFKELMWLFKKYRIPFKPTEEGVEIKHIRARR